MPNYHLQTQMQKYCIPNQNIDMKPKYTMKTMQPKKTDKCQIQSLRYKGQTSWLQLKASVHLKAY